MIADLLKALEAQAEAINHRPAGVGHLLHIAPDPVSGTQGFVVKCAGTPQDDGSVVSHTIGVISQGPTSTDYIAIENPGDAVFTLDPSQTSFNPSNPVCFCGKGPVL